MDMYVSKVQELFSAARSAFKHVKYYYFHNCLYEGVWENNDNDGKNKYLLMIYYINIIKIINAFL